MSQVVHIQLDRVYRLLAGKPMRLHVDDTVSEVLAQEGFEPKYGARPLACNSKKSIKSPI